MSEGDHAGLDVLCLIAVSLGDFTSSSHPVIRALSIMQCLPFKNLFCILQFRNLFEIISVLASKSGRERISVGL